MQNLRSCLWFDNQAEEAAKYYTSIFKNSKIGTIAHYPDDSDNPSGLPRGSVMVVNFELNGNKFMGLNGGPVFKFSEAISYVVECKDQEEIDYYWERLSADGGEKSVCGWLKDKYGLSWQVVPDNMDEYLDNPDKDKRSKAFAAVMKMTKIDIRTIENAVK